MTVIETPKLFTPVKVGNNELKHRIVLAPLTRRRADEKTAVPAPYAKDYYAQRASAGGLLISEGTFIAHEAGGMSRVPGIYSEEQLKSWKIITNAVHSKGGTIFCQIWALGRVANPKIVPNVYSAGSIPFDVKGNGSMEPPANFTVMTEADMDRFVGHYRQAALNAIEAGFDGVEIHGANGYLIDQFLQVNSNNRMDSYGSSFENRFRFPLRVLNAVCDAIGPERVGIRMSPFSRFQGMRETEPLTLFISWAEAIIKAQPFLAFIHAVQPRIEGGNDSLDSHPKENETLAPIREVVNNSGVRFIVAGGFSPGSAVKHANHTDDLVAFGRHFIPNPDLPARIQNGWPLEKYNRALFYTPDEKGYTDYSAYNPDEPKL
ncbi:NADPH2 dehydrogenase [Fusarium austroafricanum]|uniref:NADPH2 dehydrogenase n=1 Tax=Fusarium austroafricanum TaxID=2364996 RepID=A0A8H4KHR3_9HYPO|nr:NADPH2 dehydrogenase [Fusarium austroafricanum]